MNETKKLDDISYDVQTRIFSFATTRTLFRIGRCDRLHHTKIFFEKEIWNNRTFTVHQRVLEFFFQFFQKCLEYGINVSCVRILGGRWMSESANTYCQRDSQTGWISERREFRKRNGKERYFINTVELYEMCSIKISKLEEFEQYFDELYCKYCRISMKLNLLHLKFCTFVDCQMKLFPKHTLEIKTLLHVLKLIRCSIFYDRENRGVWEYFARSIHFVNNTFHTRQAIFLNQPWGCMEQCRMVNADRKTIPQFLWDLNVIKKLCCNWEFVEHLIHKNWTCNVTHLILQPFSGWMQMISRVFPNLKTVELLNASFQLVDWSSDITFGDSDVISHCKEMIFIRMEQFSDETDKPDDHVVVKEDELRKCFRYVKIREQSESSFRASERIE